MMFKIVNILIITIILHIFVRYGLISSMSFFIIDIMLFMAFVARADTDIALTMTILLSIFLLQTVFTHQNIYLTYIGLRPFIILFLTLNICSKIQCQDIVLLNKILVLILVVMFATSIAQLVLGKSHPIALLPDNLNSETVFGHETETSLLSFFRPTSIFSHTGKFGQVSWFVSFLILFCTTAITQKNKWSILQIATIIISQQKAAFSLIPVIFVRMNLHLVAIGVFLLIGLILFIDEEFTDKVYIVYEVLLSGKINEVIMQIPVRLEENLFGPLSDIPFEFLGKGIGYYSAGSQHFGGQGFFVAENSILKIFYEQSILIIITLLLITFQLWKCWRSLTCKLSKFYFTYFFTILFLWSFTHDIFGSFLNSFFIGIAISVLKYKKGTHK